MIRSASGLMIGAFALAASAFLFLAAGDASAEVEGNCDAFFGGIDVSGLDSGSKSDAIKVSEDDIVDVRFTSSAGFESHKVVVKFADIPGGSVNVDDEEDGGDTEWTGTVNIDDWAWAGAGLYKVEGTAVLSDGSECKGAVLIDVDKPFYETVAGIGAVVLTGAGVASIGATAVSSVAEGRRASRKVEDWVMDELESVSAGQTYKPPDRSNVIEDALDFFCLFMVLPALVLTGAAMATGGAAPDGGLGLPRAVWRPRLAVAGVTGGILAGIGAVVLLQQAGEIFPSTTTLILWIGVGLLLGVVLPSLIRALNVISVNRTIDRAERRLLDAGAKPGAPPANPPGEGASS